MVTPLYQCSKCKMEFNFNNIKYDQGNVLLCLDCFKKKPLVPVVIQEPKSNEPIKDQFICLECRFKFKVTRGADQKLKCPFCSKTKLMRVKKYKDENDLINDSMNRRFDY